MITELFAPFKDFKGIQDSVGFWIPRCGSPDSSYWIPFFVSGT